MFSISLWYEEYNLWLVLKSLIGLTYSQLGCSSTRKNSKTIFNGGGIGTEYVQSMLPGYSFGYPGLFSVLLIIEPHLNSVKE